MFITNLYNFIDVRNKQKIIICEENFWLNSRSIVRKKDTKFYLATYSYKVPRIEFDLSYKKFICYLMIGLKKSGPIKR